MSSRSIRRESTLYTVSTSLEKLALESSKGLVEQGITEWIKITINQLKI